MFQRFFNPESPVWRAVSRATDVVMLSLFFLICSIPILTIGPAVIALYDCVVRCVRQTEPRPYQRFFRVFRENLKIGVPLTVLGLALAAFLTVDYFLLIAVNGEGAVLPTILYGAFRILLIFPVGWFCCAFPLVSRFEFSGPMALMGTAWKLTLGHLPSLAVVALLTMESVILTLQYWYFAPMLITPALTALLSSFFLERIFQKYAPEEELPPEAETEL